MKQATETAPRVTGVCWPIVESIRTDRGLVAWWLSAISDPIEPSPEAYTGFRLLPLLRKSADNACLVSWYGVATSGPMYVSTVECAEQIHGSLALASVGDPHTIRSLEDAISEETNSELPKGLAQIFYELEVAANGFRPKNDLVVDLGGSVSQQGVPSQSRATAEELSRLAKRFAEKASHVPVVKAVLSIHSELSFNIWTISDGNPGDRQIRQRIYAIEQQMLDEFPDARVDFRLINISEWPNPSAVHLPEGAVLYQRG